MTTDVDHSREPDPDFGQHPARDCSTKPGRNTSDSIACNTIVPAIALLSLNVMQGGNVAQLVVRNLPDDLVKALKLRAARNNRSAEQEHREILQAVLRGPRRRSLAQVLGSMPNVGRDEDFARDQKDGRR
jgi:plasmid stability protein